MEKIIPIVIILLIAIFFKTIARFIGFRIMYAFLGTLLFLIVFGLIGVIVYQLTDSNIPILIISIIIYIPWLKKFIQLGATEELRVHEEDEINKTKFKNTLNTTKSVISKTQEKINSIMRNSTDSIEKIRHLKSLLDDGIISKKEFESKKEELLKKV